MFAKHPKQPADLTYFASSILWATRFIPNERKEEQNTPNSGAFERSGSCGILRLSGLLIHHDAIGLLAKI